MKPLSRSMQILHRVSALVICFMMILAISLRRDDRILGHAIHHQETSLQSPIRLDPLPDCIISTESLTGDIIGYAGPTPLRVYVHAGVIDSIEILENQETPRFYERVREGIINRYIGRTVSEARAMQVDAVSGATFTSKAVLANISVALDQVAPLEVSETDSAEQASPWSVPLVLALIVSLMAAILPLIIRHPVYRTVQLVLNVAILGCYTGTMVSYSSMVSLLSNGFSWTSIALVVLLVVAWLYPLFGRKGYYCAWCCPLGAAQELAGKISPKKWAISAPWRRALKYLQTGLWAVLMFLAWTGISFDWMNYELFSAFLFASAEWVLLAVGVLTLIISIFVPRPYCRFVCPTGFLLKQL